MFSPISGLTAGGWGHERLAEEQARKEQQDRLRTQMQFDTYASAMGGLGMAGADVPRGEGEEKYERTKRERSEDDDLDRRGDDGEEDVKRLRGDGDEE